MSSGTSGRCDEHPVRFAPPRLMLVTDRGLCPAERLAEIVALVVDHGVDAVQLREKDLADGDVLALARELRRATRGRALLFVNGRADIARAAGADGVQLPEGAIPAGGTDERGGSGLITGRSVHSAEAARAAEREGADLLVLGTIYPSRSHPGGPAGGPALVERVRAAVRLPVIGIGGIDATNADAVIRAGADGVAVISAVLGARDPAAAVGELRRTVDAAVSRMRVVLHDSHHG